MKNAGNTYETLRTNMWELLKNLRKTLGATSETHEEQLGKTQEGPMKNSGKHIGTTQETLKKNLGATYDKPLKNL